MGVDGARAGLIARPADATGSSGTSLAGSIHYQIDRDRIPDVVADLRRALASLEAAGQEAMRHQHIAPPGDDPYSPDAARKMGPELVADYLKANDREKAGIQAMIDNLNSAMRQYDAQDNAATEAVKQQA